MTRPLTILSVAFPFARVGPDAVGGAEQVLSALDYALTRSGHRSIVVACKGSTVAGTLIPIPLDNAGLENSRAATHNTIRATIAALLSRTNIDVVHMHGLDFHAYLPPSGPPVLVTLHLPPSWYPANAIHPMRPDTWLHAVSASQHSALCQIAVSPVILPPIANGVPLQALGTGPHARRRFALTLGRICPEKGQHLAIDAANSAATPLLIAGEVFPYPEHRAYFSSQIVPRLSSRHRWIGPVGFARKRRLLSAARCLLIPSSAPETSSLVAMEAAACGTPVIAFRSGALPEIVEEDLTGFIVDTSEEMAAAIHHVDRIDPSQCRRVAQSSFSFDRTFQEYLTRYRALAGAPVWN